MPNAATWTKVWRSRADHYRDRQSLRRRAILEQAWQRTGLTQAQLAIRVSPGWHGYNISDLIRGRTRIDDDTFARLLQACASACSGPQLDAFWNWLVLTLEGGK
jgi:hypothetical protein